MNTFAKRLRYYREKAKLNQKQLAKIVNIPYTTYSGYEIKDSQPPFEILLKLAAALGVDVNTLVGYKKDEKAARAISGSDYKELIQEITEARGHILDSIALLPEAEGTELQKTIEAAFVLMESSLQLTKDIYTAYLEAENSKLFDSAVKAGAANGST